MSDVTLAFAPLSKTPANGYYTIKFPNDQLVYDGTTQCQTQAGDDLDCSITDQGDTFTVKIDTDCEEAENEDCPKNTSKLFTIKSALNAGYIADPLMSEIEITVFNLIEGVAFLVDQKSTGIDMVPSLTPGTITNLDV